MGKVVVALALASLGLGLVSLHLVRTLRAERASNETLQGRVQDLESQLAQRPPVAALADELPDTFDSPGPVSATSASALKDRAPPAQGPVSPEEMQIRQQRIRASVERQRALLRDPDYRAAMLVRQRGGLERMYRDLPAELGITQEKADELLNMLAEQQVRQMEQREPILGDGRSDPAAQEEQRRRAEEMQRESDAQIAAVLGDTGPQRWREYQATIGIRHSINELSSSLAARGEPLRTDQIQPLRQALLAAQEEDAAYWRNDPERLSFAATADRADRIKQQEQWLEFMRERAARTRQAVAAILTPTQLEHFAAAHEAQLKMQEAQLRMARAQADAQARGEIAGDADSAGGLLLVEP